MNTTKGLLIAASSLLLTLGGVSAASAQDFPQSHPRRAEVNQRLDHQNARINAAERSGSIGPAKAARLHAAVRRVRLTERGDAARHHGHITRVEKTRLNHKENRIDRRI